MKTIKNTFGTTVNDVVSAARTMMLRHWLMDHDALPDKALVAGCPVSVHEEQKDAPGTNKVSSMFVSLPVQIEDPVGQLLAIHQTTKGNVDFGAMACRELVLDLGDMATGFAAAASISIWRKGLAVAIALDGGAG